MIERHGYGQLQGVQVRRDQIPTITLNPCRDHLDVHIPQHPLPHPRPQQRSHISSRLGTHLTRRRKTTALQLYRRDHPQHATQDLPNKSPLHLVFNHLRSLATFTHHKINHLRDAPGRRSVCITDVRLWDVCLPPQPACRSFEGLRGWSQQAGVWGGCV